jgi:hypothetical protein
MALQSDVTNVRTGARKAKLQLIVAHCTAIAAQKVPMCLVGCLWDRLDR